ncbi:hypothetical protein [Rhizobium sp. K102]|uniref:DUF7940 domain-containing protein n=1 Tax=Rhizobium sp. K102 TaxID=2918527 RepID=UPI001EFAAECE|nr:hypothetical protein [Rhizobium sp. K102]ULR43092.1 hypothetical protein MHI61_17820 [Rhizobium sp. K102]
MLVHNWRAVLRRAWSVRLMALALFFIVLEPVTNAAAAGASRNLYVQLAVSAASGLLTAAAIVARIVFQQQISGELNGKSPSEG